MDLYPDKRGLIFNMSQGDFAFQALLDEFSVKELKILRKHSDLMDRVREVHRMTIVQIMAELQDEYDLDIDTYNSKDMWVSTDKLDDAIPKWFTTSHCGWFKSLDNGEFLEWAQGFLMQEVRISIWCKYLEHKKNPKHETHYGMYL